MLNFLAQLGIQSIFNQPYKMQKSIRLVKYIFLAILTCVIIGCVGIGSNTSPNSESATTGTFKVAIVFPDSITDGSWSQSGYDGLKLIEAQLNSQVAYTDRTDYISEDEIKNKFRQYAKEGFDFIIGHGGRFVPIVEAVAQEFPRTKFAVVGAPYAGNNKNLGSLSFRGGELGYLTGAIAALKTKVNKVAYIGGVDYPHKKEHEIFFTKGAKSVNPNISVTAEWVGSWTDTEKAETIAKNQMNSGVDVISPDADPCTLGVHKLAQEKGIYSIGWIQDQYALAPKAVLTSGIQNVPALLLQGATLVREGRWEGKQYKFGIREKVQDLAPFRGSLTPEQEAKVNQIKEDILAGKIDV